MGKTMINKMMTNTFCNTLAGIVNSEFLKLNGRPIKIIQTIRFWVLIAFFPNLGNI